MRARKYTTQYRPIGHFHRRRPGWATTSVAIYLLQNICIRVSCVTKEQLVVYFEECIRGVLRRVKTPRTEVREHDFAGRVLREAQGGRLPEVGIENQITVRLGTPDLLKFCKLSLHSSCRLTATLCRQWTYASTIQMHCPHHQFRPTGYWSPIRIWYVLRHA